jgi:hypothetical protein
VEGEELELLLPLLPTLGVLLRSTECSAVSTQGIVFKGVGGFSKKVSVLFLATSLRSFSCVNEGPD